MWLFDPAVLVDDDGTGCLYFGGGIPDGKDADPATARVVKLGDDMISLDGAPQTINPPYLFEDSGINKIGSKYYYTYCSNWSTDGNDMGLTGGAIEYMTADNPMGPFTYGGELFKNQGCFFGLYGNNHHSIIEFEGQLYLFYHNRSVEAAMGITGNYRSPQADIITMDGEKINPVTGTMTGIAQLKPLNPYEKVQAETISRQAGVNVSGLGDTLVTDIQSGDWISVSGAEFSRGASEITVCVNAPNGGAIKVCTGDENGTVVGYVDIPTGTNGEISASVTVSSGNYYVYFIFSEPMDMDYWYFK